MLEVESFGFEATGELEVETEDSYITVPIRYVGESAPPDRTRANLTLNVVFLLLQLDLITIGDDTWTTNPQTQMWERVATGSLGLPDPVLLLSGGTPALSGAAVEGVETVDGKETYRVSGIAQLRSLSGIEDGSPNSQVWIGVDDSLVHRITASGTVALDGLGLSLSTLGIAGDGVLSLDMRFTYFDQPVSIEQPTSIVP